jgi:flagellar hook-length control protein FliK
VQIAQILSQVGSAPPSGVGDVDAGDGGGFADVFADVAGTGEPVINSGETDLPTTMPVELQKPGAFASSVAYPWEAPPPLPADQGLGPEAAWPTERIERAPLGSNPGAVRRDMEAKETNGASSRPRAADTQSASLPSASDSASIRKGAGHQADRPDLVPSPGPDGGPTETLQKPARPGMRTTAVGSSKPEAVGNSPPAVSDPDQGEAQEKRTGNSSDRPEPSKVLASKPAPSSKSTPATGMVRAESRDGADLTAMPTGPIPNAVKDPDLPPNAPELRQKAVADVALRPGLTVVAMDGERVPPGAPASTSMGDRSEGQDIAGDHVRTAGEPIARTGSAVSGSRPVAETGAGPDMRPNFSTGPTVSDQPNPPETAAPRRDGRVELRSGGTSDHIPNDVPRTPQWVAEVNGTAVGPDMPVAGADGDVAVPVVALVDEARPTDSGPPGARGAEAGGSGSSLQRGDLPRAVTEQLVANVRTAADGVVDVQLSPEELGRVRLTLQITDGSLSLLVQAERSETLDLLRRNIDVLAREFRDQGFTSLSFAFGGDHGQPTGGGRQEPDARDMTPSAPSLSPLYMTSGAKSRAIPTSAGLDLRL